MHGTISLSRMALGLAAALSLAACGGARDTEASEPAGQSAQPAPQPMRQPAERANAPAPGQEQVVSPRDTAEMRFANDRIFIDYGRPSMRGRTIMGGLVPYGRVWRTGANAATTFVTPRDLRIGGTRVPAGTYTLYTLPGESEWQLIINRQTGQWGTEYDQSQDLARIPMRVERLAEPVEQFAIDLEPGSGNVFNLALRWENTRAWVRGQVDHPTEH
ncbi:MAG TPA: DUF2911 domain-containing protein [Longimicrobium sp.]|nr:DUF2911 domain-containing protein [Longimicrobium sp.]